MSEQSAKSWFSHESLSLVSNMQLRLLRISSEFSLQIECDLQVYDDPVSAGYTCLSYEWGPAENEQAMHIILINGAQLRVRQNLWDFLTTFKLRMKSSKNLHQVKLWIDAICIDQKNLKEKDQLVQRMGQIYRAAQNVISWLGVPYIGTVSTPGSKFLQAQVEWVRRLPETELGAVLQMQDIALATALGSIHRVQKAEIDLMIFAASREYWERAWIVQELALAMQNEFWYNQGIISRERLKSLLGKAYLLYAVFGLPIEIATVPESKVNVMRIQNTPENGYKLTNLYSVLPKQLFMKCSDPTDRIYSILALIEEGASIAVDYESSRVSLDFRILWACRASFCLCIGRDSIRALDIVKDLDKLDYVSASVGSNVDHCTIAFIEITGMHWNSNIDIFTSMITTEDLARRQTRAPEIVAHGFHKQCRCPDISVIFEDQALICTNQTILCVSTCFRISSAHVLLEHVHNVYQAVAIYRGGTVKRQRYSGLCIRPDTYGQFIMEFTLPGYVDLMLEFAQEVSCSDDCFHSRTHNNSVCYEYRTL